jgi:hypothetical protein
MSSTEMKRTLGFAEGAAARAEVARNWRRVIPDTVSRITGC